ncbi:Alanine--tRNA ligase [Ascosphaera pollenicola]|nr:Alanine--tRNA ligase [Ascosphaera pollenicola]
MSTVAAGQEAASQWPAKKVRDTFLDFFKQNGHTFVPSSSVVPHADPTLLFANAGMNQYKSIFLGTVDPNSDFAHLKRANNSQKDLDDVGKDSYHHTFFEMLGNWSFGDYFKKEAIQYSWDLLTEVYGLDPSRLYVTYFEGKPEAGLEPDLEAKQCWLNVGVAEDHVLTGDMKDNFWEMGDQGPCGPCSEIHYDRIGGRNAAHLVNQDDPNVLEIWNNVFIQYNRESDGSLKPLPARHVDTGMGYERLVSVLQDKSSNYDTDVFTPLFDRIQEITGVRAYTGKFGAEDVDGIDTAYRVVADHVRTLSFAIADGAPPNNEGRGYVVRRVLRRGARYARKYLGVDIGNFFSKIVPTLVDQMGDMFPELKRKASDICEILNEEELSFAKTLDRGEKLFENYADQAKKNGLTKLHGADVWRLYDTYGFPVDLTQLMCEERGLTIDNNEFEEARLKAREASKGQGKVAGETVKLSVHDIGALDAREDIERTDDSAKYGRENIDATVKAIYYNGQFADDTSSVPENARVGVVLDRTNFYAEQGGQEYDTGHIMIDEKVELMVLDVQQYGGYVLHVGYLKYGVLSKGDKVICEYDELRRWPIRNNHTGTHILNFALREVLGEGVEQKGSLVAAEKLRFDFSHKSAVSDKDLETVENKCTDYIRQNCSVYSQEVPLSIARNISGVRAVFGETYPDPVRVVSVGVELEEILKDVSDARWKDISIEFCGGTHVARTGDIKELIVLEESGIAKGIRRIIAVTGEEALRAQIVAKDFEKRLDAFEKMENGPAKEQEAKLMQTDLNQLTISAVTKSRFRERFTQIHKKLMDAQKALQKAESKKALDTITTYFKDEQNKDKPYLVVKLPIGANSKAVSDSLNHMKTKVPEKSLYVFAADGSKVAHGCYVAKNLSEQGATANDWAGAVSKIVGGRSGGKAPTSIGNGPEASKVDDALEAATEYLKNFKF